MLTVVEHDEQLLATQELHQRLLDRLSGPRRHVKHRRQSVGHAGGVAYRCQLAQPRPVPEAGQHLGGDLQSQSGLADPADPAQGHHPGFGQRRRRALQLTVPPHERAHLQRQIPREGVQSA
jgi:hypothetical protein